MLSIFEPKYSFTGADYNYILNIEQSQIELNYDSGNIYGIATPTKNVFNSIYSENSYDTGSITKSREYCGINTSNNKIYLKYFDNSIIRKTNNNFHNNNVNLTKTNYPYQKIESYKPYKLESTAKHKSNLFSITLRNVLPDNDSDNQENDESIKQVKKEINIIIHEIVKNICPVETQLYKVNFESNYI